MLEQTAPLNWRRVLVDDKTTFFELHHIIQIAMGWENYHIFEFKIDNYSIGVPYEELDDFDFGNNKLVDASTLTLDDIIANQKKKFSYEYDFGDGWKHQIIVEQFLPRESSKSYPICIDGKLNCPPEDCGGVAGFYQFLDIIEDNTHPDHDEMFEWIGGHYNVEYFDKEEINNKLKLLNKYIKEWND